MLLGLDISSIKTGWCVLDSLALIDYGTIQISNRLSPFDRLVYFGEELVNIINIFPIQKAIIEDGFYSSNLRTTKLLAYFTGVAVYELIRRGIEVELMSVQTVRKFFGKSLTKVDIFNLLNDCLKLNLIFEDSNDITDAIAVAVSYIGLKEDRLWEDDVLPKLVNLKIS